MVWPRSRDVMVSIPTGGMGTLQASFLADALFLAHGRCTVLLASTLDSYKYISNVAGHGKGVVSSLQSWNKWQLILAH
jgi:hypothetical protein